MQKLSYVNIRTIYSIPLSMLQDFGRNKMLSTSSYNMLQDHSRRKHPVLLGPPSPTEAALLEQTSQTSEDSLHLSADEELHTKLLSLRHATQGIRIHQPFTDPYTQPYTQSYTQPYTQPYTQRQVPQYHANPGLRAFSDAAIELSVTTVLVILISILYLAYHLLLATISGSWLMVSLTLKITSPVLRPMATSFRMISYLFLAVAGNRSLALLDSIWTHAKELIFGLLEITLEATVLGLIFLLYCCTIGGYLLILKWLFTPPLSNILRRLFIACICVGILKVGLVEVLSKNSPSIVRPFRS